MKRAKRIVWKVFPFEMYDLEFIQSWLEDRAKEGLFLQGFILRWAKFTVGTPQTIRYRLEPAAEAEPDKEKLDLYAQYGWRYVATWSNEYYIFMADDENARELYTDPHTLAIPMRKRLRSRCFWTLFGAVFWLANLVGLFVAAFWNGYPLLNWIQAGTIQCAIVVILLLIEIFSLVGQFSHYSKLKTSLKKGKPIRSGAVYGKQVRRWYLSFAATMILIISLLFYPVFLGNQETGMQLPEYEGNLPFLQISDFEEEPLQIGGFFYDGCDQGNYLVWQSDVLAPKQWKLTQLADTVPPRADGGGFYWVEYYQAKSSAIASRLGYELLVKYPRSEGCKEEILSLGEDIYGVYSQTEGKQYLLLQKDTQVEMIYYNGNVSLKPLASEYLQAWERS